MDVKRQRFGEPLATIPVEVAGAETTDMMTDDPVPLVDEGGRRERSQRTCPEICSDPRQMRMACLRVSSVKSLQKPSPRTEWSIVESP